VPYTGHADGPGKAHGSGFIELLGAFAGSNSDPRITTMIVLAGASSFFVGNAFQAQMPEYAQLLGADDTGTRYSVLMAANAAGAVVGAVLLEGSSLFRPGARTAIVCAILWGIAMGLFPMTNNYLLAVTLLVVAGVFNIVFTSMAQTIVQMLAPARLRGTAVGLFNTAMLGLRAGAGVTIGMLGTFIGVRQSLELSSLMVVVVSLALFVRNARDERRHLTTP
jgi:sugar phosphate permease